MSKKVLAIHQPDFLPYSGFFYKLAKADYFLIGDYYSYSDSGYIQRVKLGGEWLTEMVVDKKKLTLDTPISKVYVDAEVTYQRILSAIDKHLKDAPHYKRVKKMIRKWGDEYGFGVTSLSFLNMSLIEAVCDELGIEVRGKMNLLMYDKPKDLHKGELIVEIMKRSYPEAAYLSGAGGKGYIGTEFEDAGIELLYSSHKAKYSDSILAVIAYEDNPLSIVLAD